MRQFLTTARLGGGIDGALDVGRSLWGTESSRRHLTQMGAAHLRRGPLLVLGKRLWMQRPGRV
jgi:hypothetical protein